MRFLLTLINDIRYQMKYGFYILYTFISAVYIAVLLVCPTEYKRLAASLIILTDPAMLGTFFIGGIWLLEKQEGLHGFWGISPLRPFEYILSKAVSLALISILSANLIIVIGLREAYNFLLLTAGVFVSSMVFNLIGLMVATYARSVNHYMLIVSPPMVIFSVPPILTAFGITHPVMEIMPGTALWRTIGRSLGIADMSVWLWVVLLIWLGLVLYPANRRIPRAMLTEGGKAE